MIRLTNQNGMDVYACAYGFPSPIYLFMRVLYAYVGACMCVHACMTIQDQDVMSKANIVDYLM